MTSRSGPRLLLPLAAIALAIMLGGCVVYPAYPAYGYGSPYYGGGYVGYGGGYGGGWHEGGWRR